jgi:hypothetical protein
MKLRDLLSALRRRNPLGRPKPQERAKAEKEKTEPDVTEVLGPTGGQVGNPHSASSQGGAIRLAAPDPGRLSSREPPALLVWTAAPQGG